ncbi:MAG: L-fucose/L-arabinose isomerase family protein [Planctomycetota bacterium]
MATTASTISIPDAPQADGVVSRRRPLTAHVGAFAVGHDSYWPQFDGLLDELMRGHRVLVDRLASFGVQTTDFGMADDAESAYAMVQRLRAADLDLIVCNMVTYATSATWGIIAREIDTPIVLVGLQPLAALDYDRANTYMQLCNDNICAIPEFTGVSVRMGKAAPPCVIGHLHDDPQADAELREWCDIARVLHDLKGARFGQMGHALEAMLDMHHDPTMFTAGFGLHVVMCEPDDVMRHYQAVTETQIAVKSREILGFFDTPAPQSDPITRKLTDADLAEASRVAVALDAFIKDKNLDGLAYYYEASEGSDMRRLVTNFIVGNSLLTAAGFPMCGENDLKTCVAMMILDRLGIGGSFAEFHPVDFKEGFVLVGHDGPHHLNIADGKPVLRSLTKYHGKPGAGASVEFKIKEGPITMLGITQTADGRFKFVTAEGESAAGPIPPTGNTNTRGFFEPDVRTFLKRWFAQGPTHHFALGVGHHAQTIVKLAGVLGIECAVVETQ